MIAPPLDAVVFFVGLPPSARALPVGAPPRFKAYLLKAPFPALEHALADPNQPLTLDERDAAADATTALHLRCALDLPLGERLSALLRRLEVLFAAGGVAAALPAAQRVFGPALLAASHAAPDREARWLEVFVHRHAVHDGDRAWLHTHGMEHFGLPDFECSVAGDVAPAQEIIDAAVECAVLDAPLRESGFVQLARRTGSVARFTVRRAAARRGHDWGVYGALDLVLEPTATDPRGATREETSQKP